MSQDDLLYQLWLRLHDPLSFWIWNTVMGAMGLILVGAVVGLAYRFRSR